MQSIGLCLVDPGNQYQRLLQREAEAAARTAGLEVETRFCTGDFAGQLAILSGWLEADRRPVALLVMALRDRGLGGVARRAAEAGVHLVLLNHTEDPLDEVRRDHPGVIVCQVRADEEEAGRVQGRLVDRRLPDGGRILLVEGSRRSLTARGRTAGLQEVLGRKSIAIDRLEAGWTEEEGAAAVRRWLGISMQCRRRLDLVVCHNDSLALGARTALNAAAGEMERPDLRGIPVVGCDGAPDLGQAKVRQGALAATVVLPRLGETAVEAIALFLRTGRRPAPVRLLRGTPFPEDGVGVSAGEGLVA
jgi:ABC-type sugar transport system substrate-binding protein